MLRFLLIDDNPQDRLLAIRALEREFSTLEVEEVIKAEDLALALERGQFDLVITDYQLRWSDGLAVLRAIKARYPECPVIMFTNSGSEEVAVEAMKAGLDDYVIKSAKHYIRLALAVRSGWEKTQTKRKVMGLENRLQGLLNQLNVGVFRRRFDGSIVEANPAFFRLLGLDEDAQAQANVSLASFFKSEDYAQLLNELKENGQIKKHEVQLQRADGRVIWVHLNKTLITIDGQTIIDGLIEDISDRKRAEEERFHREQEFRALVENAPDIIARFDKELRYVYVNPAVELATGIPPERLIGKTRVEYGTPEEVYTLWQEKTRQVFVTGKECLYEFEFPAPDGKRYFQTRMVPELALDGTVESVLCIGRDVTEYKRAEQALRESEARFRRLIDSNVIGCIFWDISGMITDANHAFLQMVGYTREDLLAGKMNWKDMTPVEHLSGSEQAIAQMKQVGTADALEKEYIRSDGSRVPVLLGGVMLEGYQDRGVSFVLDLSKQKQLENQLRQQAEQLEQANRLKDEFLAILSHELRSPLNSILGWAKLLRTRNFDEATTARAIETIERNAALQTQLVEDLLDVSRILQGKFSLNISPTNLASTIDAAIETMHLAAQAKSIQVECFIDSDVGLVAGDPNRLQQVVWNLLSNAIKFTPPGGTVMVSLERNGSEAQIQVSDTGKGINADFLPHVFDYFRQGDSSITRTHGGLGLGLAIVRYLVELHGGTIDAESPGEGKGATFTVRLPLMKAQPQTSNSEEVCDRALSLLGVRVLVVDDEPDTRELIKFVLENSGAQAIAVASAGEALLAFEQWSPDVLVSDIGMPQEDGYTLIRKLRARESKQGKLIPAVALTAYAREEDYRQAMEAGFQRHIPKPVEPNELVAVVAHLVGRLLD
jgi:PAS domain S-box-containing protein